MAYCKEIVFFVILGLLRGSIGHPSNGKGLVPWYTDCEGFYNEGTILNVTLSNCDQPQNCILEKETTQSVQVYFLAGKHHSELLYNVYVYSGSDYYYLEGGTNLRNVIAGDIYAFEVDFQVPAKVVNGQNILEIYQFQAGQPSNSYEFCTRFAIQGLRDPPPTPSPPPTESTTTTTTSTSTTTESTTLPPGPFQCRSQGTFPDPYSCSKYHICSLLQDGSFWQQTLECSFGTVFCPLMSNCFHPDSCPCNLS